MRWIVVATLLCLVASASADEQVDATAELPGRHVVYLELLGKGGLYGLGYEYTLNDRFSVGGAASFSQLRDQQVYTLAPYGHATLLEGERHAMYGELGAILAHERVPSPVMDWDGVSETGIGGFASLGWQYTRGQVLLRTSGSIVVGEGGVGPMLGFAIGARP